ncbi:cytochrome c nitrite reductase subunit NrfD [Enterovibrio nigricans]|uniref:Respiratory nitrite reductase specific menaquinol--cytochrome-c reductase complex subunit NrfD n=1 Tax=Enterovibrio nigricans DSM 22720 TaxID=1121868 RepID=A0A1T4VZK0_9GAMM|nr:cytochrome c nitrite reductase subunit NrfD [Enterovibrio nigricans]PKF49039.1 cytochrome c nitrite reductase subunit NrfD [Enterovibrio nigricans]SKA70319.1 respiratory nitrite reductase specific menaquinol--cytochrome-c reductase complex subunit NrfD [Enterovibrio nigricans DSM 22720]
MSMIDQAFHFDSLVWDWIIAVYLFLAGVSAGAVMIAVYLKRNVIEGDVSKNGIIRATAIIAPLGIILGLLILVFHLTKPWEFWKIMIYFNPSSVMSMGVVLFQVYMMVLFAWLAGIFLEDIQRVFGGLLNKIPGANAALQLTKRFDKGLEITLAVLAFILAAYTGFLLSALKTYPLLNNPVLPILFLFSSLSSGAAACLLVGVLAFKESIKSPSVHWIHRFERPVVLFELFVLFAFFSGLYFGGGQKEAAVIAAIGGGFWSNWFWIGVVGLGMVLPLAMNTVASAEVRHRTRYLAVVTTLSLLGVLMLRTFILYAGQMTTV